MRYRTFLTLPGVMVAAALGGVAVVMASYWWPSWQPRQDVLHEAWGWAASCTDGSPRRAVDLSSVVWRRFRPGAFNDTLPGAVIGLTAITDTSGALATSERPDTIYIDDAHADTVWVLAHELVHHILGRPGHPMVPFAFPCRLMDWQHATAEPASLLLHTPREGDYRDSYR